MEFDKRSLFDEALRRDFSFFLRKAFETVSGGDTFVPNWHIEAIAWELERIREGENTHLIVTMPPRYLKSITISVAWVAWMLGKDPAKRFVCVSYSSDLAKKHANDCRAILQTAWYQKAFPQTRIPRGGGGEMDFQTTNGGGRLSTSVGGTLTGRGGDIIIIDDPIKPADAMSETARTNVLNWYSNTLVSRQNDKAKNSIILVMQRLHENDLAGHLLDRGCWQHLCLPSIAESDEIVQLDKTRTVSRKTGDALHPERESVSQLGELRSTVGSAVFSAQYQQAPVPAGGLFVQREWLRRYKFDPAKSPWDTVIQSWDTASKDGVLNDYSVCITAVKIKREVFIIDVFRGKLKFPDLKRKVEELAAQYETDVLLIEDAASGTQLIQQLKEDQPENVPWPIACKPEADKISRFSAQSSKIEAGELLLPIDAPWLAEFEREVLGFPNTKHDDQADALAQLLVWRKPQQQEIAFFGAEIIIPSLE